MKNRRLHIITVLFLLLFSTAVTKVNAQKANALLDSTAIKIGQQVKLKLSIQYRADNGKHTQITWPVIADTLTEKVEVVSVGKIDTIIDQKDPYLITQTKDLLLTSFDSGYWAIPPFRFMINGDTNGIATDPLLLQVTPIAVDTTLAIKDIKAPFGETYTWWEWLQDNMYVVWGTLAALLLIVIAIILIRKMRKIEPPMVIIEKPKIPAHIIAFEKLDKLIAEKLWQEGKLKQYHSGLTDIVREYIENRFQLPAMEQTTDEILYGFRNVAIDEESKGKLKQVLTLADLVKFAKENPMANENELSYANTVAFINGTMRDEETQKTTTDCA